MVLKREREDEATYICESAIAGFLDGESTRLSTPD